MRNRDESNFRRSLKYQGKPDLKPLGELPFHALLSQTSGIFLQKTNRTSSTAHLIWNPSFLFYSLYSWKIGFPFILAVFAVSRSLYQGSCSRAVLSVSAPSAAEHCQKSPCCSFWQLPAEDLGRPLFQACMLHLSYQIQTVSDRCRKLQTFLNTLQLLYQINTCFHQLLGSLHKNCKFCGQEKWREST